MSKVPKRYVHEHEARNLAALSWLELREDDLEFRRNYPDCRKYVEEWWEERYLPIVQGRRQKK